MNTILALIIIQILSETTSKFFLEYPKEVLVEGDLQEKPANNKACWEIYNDFKIHKDPKIKTYTEKLGTINESTCCEDLRNIRDNTKFEYIREIAGTIYKTGCKKINKKKSKDFSSKHKSKNADLTSDS